MINSSNLLNINRNNKRNNNNLITNNSKSNNQETKSKVKKIMEYNDDEINTLPYELALQFDKRSYCQYYISLLRTKHNFIFSFCYYKDYNSKIIKIYFLLDFQYITQLILYFIMMIQCTIYM